VVKYNDLATIAKLMTAARQKQGTSSKSTSTAANTQFPSAGYCNIINNSCSCSAMSKHDCYGNVVSGETKCLASSNNQTMVREATIALTLITPSGDSENTIFWNCQSNGSDANRESNNSVSRARAKLLQAVWQLLLRSKQ